VRIARKNKKGELIAAAVRLTASGGPGAVTIRAIAREAGVTDAAVYRHYRSKDDLCRRAHHRIVDEMIREKRHLVDSDAPLRWKLCEWVRLSYAYYDRHPAAFTYVLSTPHLAPRSERSTATGQGGLFLGMITRAIETGEARSMPPELALSHFAGVLLNVPRMINEGTLAGPASAYSEKVSEVVWRIFRPESS
jgi:AcrR family transcriptional regulator